MRRAKPNLIGMMALLLALCSPAAPRAQPTADAPAGEPAFWTVTGLTRGSRLNLRADHAPSGRVLARLDNGDTLRNRGCRLVDNERWCRVERPEGGAGGWVIARYLRDGATPATRAPEPEPVFDATGTLPCAVIPGQTSRECAFGVRRSTPGTASIRVTGTGGTLRWIYFDAGAPVRSDGQGNFAVERISDLFLIRIGGERYEVPLAVATGG